MLPGHRVLSCSHPEELPAGLPALRHWLNSSLILPRQTWTLTSLFFNLLLSFSRHPISEYKNEHFLSAIMSTHSGIGERRLGLAGYQNRGPTYSRAVEFAAADLGGQFSSSVSAFLSGETRLLGSRPNHGLV